MLAVLNARLGAGGRYQAYPEAPVGSRYYTLMFVKVGTVTVQGSGREVGIVVYKKHTKTATATRQHATSCTGQTP